MTMIACTLNDRFLIIHSDILITGDVKPPTFYVPALKIMKKRMNF